MNFMIHSLLLVAPVAMGALIPTASFSQQASVECQGDCQNENQGAPNTIGVVRALARDFMEPFTAPAQPVDGHMVIFNTPAIDMIFEYLHLNSATAQAPETTMAPVATQVNRFADEAESAQDSVFTAVSVETVVQEYVTSVPQVQDESKYAPLDFDVREWGQRVDEAAHKLANKVDAVVVRFLSDSPAENSAVLPYVPQETQINSISGLSWF
ncbi:hypothetical protein GGI07_000256 [Coemansia sp. Benny D115]|nr:hypothetical protein GGI07_000256 [Coemansia sp. Benny D115]